MLVQGFAGDSLLVWDPFLRRLSRLSATSGSGSDLLLPAAVANGGTPIVGMLDDGRLVIRNERFMPDEGTGAMMVTTTFGVLAQSGARVTNVLEWPAVPNGDAEGFRFFAPRIQATVEGDRLIVGYGAGWPLHMIGPSGDTLGTLSRATQPRPVTEADKAAVREAMRRPNLAPGFLDDDRFNPTHPAFGAVLPGPRRTTWVFGYAPPYLAPDSVSVFGRDGDLLGVLPLPVGFKPTDVTDDEMVGTARTPDGDLEVRLYGLGWN